MSTTNLWTFGCSFTEGGGLDQPYLDRHKNQNWYLEEYKNTIWPILLSKQLDLNLHNKGINGSSVLNMVFNMLINLSNIKPGDIVIAGLTSSHRFTIYNNMFLNEPYNAPYSMNTISNTHGVVEDFVNGTLKGQTTYDNDLYWSSVDFMNKEQKEILSKYLLMFNTDKVVAEGWYPRKEEEFIYTQADVEWNVAKNAVYSMGEFMRSVGVEFYIWTVNLWHRGQSYPGAEDQYFESIVKWSNFTSDDGHWSPNGHKLASKYFKWCIDNKVYDMNELVLDQWYEDIGCNERDTYIEYGKL